MFDYLKNLLKGKQVEVKVCKKCGLEKSIENFPLAKSTKGNEYRQGWCFDCYREHFKKAKDQTQTPVIMNEETVKKLIWEAIKELNQETIKKQLSPTKKTAGERVCNCCGKSLPLDMFYHDYARKDEYKTQCKKCVEKKKKIKYSLNKGTRLCHKCGKEKPIDQFHLNRSKANGLQSYCKECINGYKTKKNNVKFCRRCGKEKPVDQFWANSSAKDGLQYYCKECNKSYLKNYRKTRADISVGGKPQEAFLIDGKTYISALSLFERR